MNIENNHDHGFDPQGQPIQKTGGGGKLLKYGCGCFGILFLLCGAGALLTYIFAGDQMIATAAMSMQYGECVAEIQTSEVISDKFGGSVSPELLPVPQQEVDGDVITFTYDTKLTGAEGKEGNMHVVFKTQGKEVTREEFYVEIDGEQIDMTENGGLDLDIDDPDMVEEDAPTDQAEDGSDSGT